MNLPLYTAPELSRFAPPRSFDGRSKYERISTEAAETFRQAKRPQKSVNDPSTNPDDEPPQPAD